MRHVFDFRGWVITHLRILQADVDATRLVVNEIPARFNRLERFIMATSQEVLAQLADANDATNNIADDVARLKDKLDQALADNQDELDAAVASALQEVSDGLSPLVSRLQGVASETPEDVEPEPGDGDNPV